MKDVLFKNLHYLGKDITIYLAIYKSVYSNIPKDEFNEYQNQGNLHNE